MNVQALFLSRPGTRIFHYDSLGHLIAETNQSGQMLGEYIYFGDQLLAMIRPGEVAYYFHNDHLGTPQVLTNDSQTIAWKAAYAPFGQEVSSVQTVENPFRFPGQYYDQETGLYYNYHRYYDPMTGRYVTPDPIGLEGGINLFTYVQNNPITFSDPSGEQVIKNPPKQLPNDRDEQLRAAPKDECPKNCGRWKKQIVTLKTYIKCSADLECINKSGRVLKTKSEVGTISGGVCMCPSEGRICCPGELD
jgi:RHS repeat-associated protein